MFEEEEGRLLAVRSEYTGVEKESQVTFIKAHAEVCTVGFYAYSAIQCVICFVSYIYHICIMFIIDIILHVIQSNFAM